MDMGFESLSVFKLYLSFQVEKTAMQCFQEFCPDKLAVPEYGALALPPLIEKLPNMVQTLVWINVSLVDHMRIGPDAAKGPLTGTLAQTAA